MKKYILVLSEDELDHMVACLKSSQREHQAALADHEIGILKKSCFELDCHRVEILNISRLLDKVSNAERFGKRKKPRLNRRSYKDCEPLIAPFYHVFLNLSRKKGEKKWSKLNG